MRAVKQSSSNQCIPLLAKNWVKTAIYGFGWFLFNVLKVSLLMLLIFFFRPSLFSSKTLSSFIPSLNSPHEVMTFVCSNPNCYGHKNYGEINERKQPTSTNEQSKKKNKKTRWKCIRFSFLCVFYTQFPSQLVEQFQCNAGQCSMLNSRALVFVFRE